MSRQQTPVSWLWKIPIAGVVYALGTILGGASIGALELEMPSVPMEVEPVSQMALLFLGGMAMSLALAAMAIGIAGRWWQRWGILAAFILVVYGVGNALEGSIFTTLGGQWTLMLITVPAGSLCALAVTLLFSAPSGATLAARLQAFRTGLWRPGFAWRLGLAVLAFPFFYLLFGMIIAPIVTPHYAQLDFLTIPPMTTILGVLFVRSAMFLVVSLAVVAAWSESRFRLVIGLGLAHFMAVGFVGLIQTTFFPAVLRWTHGIEILADSMFYAWVLVWLFGPSRKAVPGDRDRGRRESESREPEERLA